MSGPLNPLIRLRIIGILIEILSVALANLPQLLVFSLLVELPLFLVDSFLGREEYPQYPGMVFLSTIAWGLRSGFAAHLVDAAWGDRQIPVAQPIRAGIRDALNGLNAAVVFSGLRWLAFAVILMPSHRRSAEILVGARLVFSVASLWLMSVFGLSILVDSLDQTATTESFQHSASLSRGHRWQMAVLLGVFAVLEAVAEQVVVHTVVAERVPFFWHATLAVIGALGAPALPVIYSHLHRDRESRSVEALAAVFE